MRSYQPVRHAFAALLILALLTAVALLPARADALVRMTPTVALWRILAHEASLPRWDEESEEWVSRRTGRPWGQTDVFGIHEVLLRGVEREHMSYVAFAQTYAHRMWDALSPVELQRAALGIPLDGNRWAGFMREDLRRPTGWTARDGAWDPEAARYALELARDAVQYDLLALEEFSPCTAPVDDWGGRMDHEHARSIGLVEVDCGPDAINTFFARPSQIRLRAQLGEDRRLELDVE
jgi:hypothetical protein